MLIDTTVGRGGLLQLLLYLVYQFLFIQVSYSQVTFVDDSISADPIQFEFLKGDVELPKPGSYFNVLRVTNNRNDVFTGEITVKVPEGWKILGPSTSNIQIDPGQEYIFPVRISMSPILLGGISYLVNAELKGDGYYDYTSSYISIASDSRWDMNLADRSVYISDYHPHGEFAVSLNNKGNINELIKLSFDTGELLEYVNPLEGDSIQYVDLPAYKDTSLTFKVREKPSLSYAEERALINNWRSSSILLTASTSDFRKSSGLRVLALESRREDQVNQRTTPLNVDVSLNNILSSQYPKASVKAAGKILFPGTQQLQYSAGLYNIYFNQERNQNFDLYKQMRFMLRYSDRNTMVWFADRMGSGELHTLSGQGLRSHHTINDKHTFYLNAVNNPFSKTVGAYAGYSTNIKKINFSTGVTLETTTNNSGGHYSYHLGTTFSFLRRHRVRLSTVTSINRFSPNALIQQDTTTVGIAYRASYNYNGEKFQFRIDNTNTKLSYLRNSGVNRFNIRTEYLINDGSRLEGLYYRNSYDATKYPYNFFFPSNKNINDNGNLLYAIVKNKIIYRVGPQYTNSTRLYYNPSDGFINKYQNLQPGILTSITFKLGLLRSMTPYIRLNSMFVNYNSEDPAFLPYQVNGMMQYTAGLSYYDQAFKFNAYYSSGEASDLYRSVVVDQEPIVNQAFHIRPYYERYFKKDKIRTSAYLSYSYYMPSTRENTILNLTSDFFLNGGWRIFLSFNLYRNVRADEVAGRITTRDVNLLTGVRKSFDIQQPRLSYYDLYIIGFNDKNGDGLKDETEKPISNVLIQISRDGKKNLVKKTRFSEISLITDPNGEIYYENIPEGLYDLNITSLSNLEDLYFLNGENQSIEVNGDLIHYLPLVETYKVKGKVTMNRDPNSNEGRISLEGIRVTAVSEDGETLSTLTDSYGSYILSLPRATTYEVILYNVFGEQFLLEQGRYRIQFTANKTINIDFKFTEKRREVQFKEGEQLFDFNIRREE